LSYPADGNELCFAVEENSFWFRHRNEMIVETLRHFPPGGPLFDVGGGNGYVAAGLERAGFPTVLVEPGETGAANACRRGLKKVINATVDDAGFTPNSLDAVGLFDVLEHIPDDLGFLRSLHHWMRPGGRLYLTVPAFSWLWSSEDDYAGHQRRYRSKSLACVLQTAGFEVEFLTYCFWFLPLPVFLLRSIPSSLGWRARPTQQSTAREHSKKRGLAGWIVDRALSWELSRIVRGTTLWMGTSCLAVARHQCQSLSN
jgi:SAM-dependent methyltransferase